MKKQRKLGSAIFALAAVIGLTGTFATTAMADDWHGHGHAYGHERFEHEWHGHEFHGRYAEYRPYYVVRPEPVVYYRPEPVFFEQPVYYSPPSTGFNVVIPLTIK